MKKILFILIVFLFCFFFFPFLFHLLSPATTWWQMIAIGFLSGIFTALVGFGKVSPWYYQGGGISVYYFLPSLLMGGGIIGGIFGLIIWIIVQMIN
ncbi:MAG TPA: hypothetical protein ENL06_00615 [Candidatus Portnoybacteria bacterium]|nr:hypothetical protein [Candidatus Portnoybacteria bacterium]